MENIAYLKVDEKYLKERWSEVREDFWGDLKIEAQRALKRLLETGMAIEVQDLIGSAPFKHNYNRLNYRNGYYYRNLLTSLGSIDGLQVPRVREGGIEFKTIRKYKQRAEDIDKLVLEMFLSGVSTRRVKEVLEPILGEEKISSTTVSKISKILDKMVFKFHNMGLTDTYKYLILDGIYLHCKSPVYKRRRCVLVCYGIKDNGKKELIDFYLTKKGESQDVWEYFLNRLYHRGLEGNNLVLAVIDGNKGLYNAVRFIYPQILIQRCWVHKLKNVANKCPRKIQKDVIKGGKRDLLSR